MPNIKPLFTKTPLILRQRLVAANAARDGSGSISALLREDGTTFSGSIVAYSATANSTTDRFSVTIPDLTYHELDIKNGTIFQILSGTPPTGTALTTKYRVLNLVIASTTTINFNVQNLSTNVLIDLTTTGTNPVLGFHVGTRIERITWASAQATAAASSAMVGCVYLSDHAGANWRKRAEIAIPTATPTVAVVGATAVISFPGGLWVPTGVQVGVTQTVYAGVADQMDVIAEAADY